MPRDYTREYADLADKYKRATARATTSEQRARVQEVYNRAVTEVAESQQLEADERRATAAPSATPSATRPVTGAERARGLTRAAAQGATFGFGEEAEALARSLAPGKSYGEEVKRIRGEMQSYREAEPGKAMAAELAGGFVPGVGLATKAVQGVRGAGAVAKALAKSAALQGGLAGAGTAEGGLAERGAGAALGGTVGGATGYAAGKAMAPLGRAFERAKMGAGIKAKVGPRAAVVAAERAGIEDLPTTLRQAAKTAPEEARVMDVLGVPGQRMATGVRLVGGRPGQVIDEAMTQRAETASPRLMKALGLTGRQRENVVQTIDNLIEESRKQSAPLYRAFEQEAPRAVEDVDKILQTPFGQQVMDRARRLAQNARREFIEPARGAAPTGLLDELGQPIIGEATPAKYSPQALDDIKKAMDDLIYEGKLGRVQPGQGGIGPAELRAARSLRKDFLDAVDDAFPDTYAEARAAWAGPTALKSALEDGVEAAGSRVDINKLAGEVADLSASERDFFQRGYLERLRQRVDDGLLKPGEIRTEGFAKRMQAVFGDESDAIVQSLREETKLTATGQRVMGGSPTAERTQDIADIEGGLLSGRAIRAMGEKVRTSARAAEAIEARLRTPLSEKHRMGVAQTMMTPARDIGSLIRALEVEQAAQRRGEQVRRTTGTAVGRLFGAGSVRGVGDY
jgi:hypothetical protein